MFASSACVARDTGFNYIFASFIPRFEATETRTYTMLPILSKTECEHLGNINESIKEMDS